MRTFAFKRDSVLEKRAALGIELRSTGTRRDTLGVFVEAVTPKGPAESAGIVEGDRIAAINGVDLRTAAADADDSYATGLASRRLTREVQKLTPGTRVTLRVWSGGRYRDVQVTTGKASEVMRLGAGRFEFRMPMDGGEFGGPNMMMIGPGMRMMREQMPMLRKELEPMLREQLEPMRERMRDLPRRIELRTAPRIRSTMPLRTRRIYTVDGGDEWTVADGPGTLSELGEAEFQDAMSGLEETLFFEDLPDLEPYFLDLEEPIEFDHEIDSVSPEVIRDLAAKAVRDARAALSHLAADGIA